MSIRVAISVEGQTEEIFVKHLIQPHLANFGVYAVPIIVATSISAGGVKHKGGGINFDRVTNELSRLLTSYGDGAVTSLYDFYGFGGRESGESVDALERRMAAKLGNPSNLFCYVQRYEFEGLLLSDAETVARYFKAGALHRLVDEAVRRAGNPENVNDSPATAPSRRLLDWTSLHADRFRRYSKGTKTTHGPQLATQLTLPVIRGACPRFNAWIQRLENLG